MIGLDGSRVVIVDDSADEALPVIQALSSHRIPALWFTGRISELPERGKPLENIRLALLDVDLIGGGASDRQKVASLVRVVQRLIAPNATGLGIVLWTKHAELEEQFLNLLLEEGGPVPIFTRTFHKFTFERGGEFDWVALARELEQVLASSQPWPLLLKWEKESREAGGDVVSDLARLAQNTVAPPQSAAEVSAWQENVTATLATLLLELAEAELGKENIISGQAVTYGALSALTPLLQDQVDARVRERVANLAEAGDRIRERGQGRNLTSETRAKVNAKLSLYSPVHDNSWTGNIYVLRTRGGLRPAFKSIFDPGSFFEQFASSLVNKSPSAQIEERVQRLKSACLNIILVDVNPACDHAQNKTTCGRLVAGIRVGGSEYKARGVVKSPRPDFIWEYGPVYDPETAQAVYFVLDLRRLVSCSPQLLASVKPWMRLRQAVVHDLQSRLASHGGRAGVLRLPE